MLVREDRFFPHSWPKACGKKRVFLGSTFFYRILTQSKKELSTLNLQWGVSQTQRWFTVQRPWHGVMVL